MTRMGTWWGAGCCPKSDTLIKAQLRLIDFAFRYGGDEFVCCCRKTSKDQAVVVARRCRIRCGRGSSAATELEPERARQHGLATFRTMRRTPHDIIRQADEMNVCGEEHDPR